MTSEVNKTSETIVLTEPLQLIVRRACASLAAGYPVHLGGPAGAGKTTLAYQIAREYATEHNRSFVLLRGADVTARSDKLQKALRDGQLVVFDDLMRVQPAQPELLMHLVVERRMPRTTGDFTPVHKDFQALFAGTPEAFVGANSVFPDVLITIPLAEPDRETATQIIRARSGLALEDALVIVDIILEMRRTDFLPEPRPNLHACVKIARLLYNAACESGAPPLRGQAHLDNDWFVNVCRDVLCGPMTLYARDKTLPELWALLDPLLLRHAPGGPPVWTARRRTLAEAPGEVAPAGETP